MLHDSSSTPTHLISVSTISVSAKYWTSAMRWMQKLYSTSFNTVIPVGDFAVHKQYQLEGFITEEKNISEKQLKWSQSALRGGKMKWKYLSFPVLRNKFSQRQIPEILTHHCSCNHVLYTFKISKSRQKENIQCIALNHSSNWMHFS